MEHPVSLFSGYAGLNLLQSLPHQLRPAILSESWHVGCELYVVEAISSYTFPLLMVLR